MTELLVRLQLWILRHRFWVLATAGLFLVGGIVSIPRLKINDDFTVMLPMSDPAVADQVEALRLLPQSDRMYFDIHSSVDEPQSLVAAATQLEAALARIPDLIDLKGRTPSGEAGDVFRRVQEALPALMGPEDLAGIQHCLETNAVRERLSWLKRSMTQPQGLMFKEVAELDPLGLSNGVLERMRGLQSGVGGARLLEGYPASSDGRHILLSAGVAFPSSQLARSESLLPAVKAACRQVEVDFEGQIQIALTGAHRVALDNARMIQRDSVWTSTVATGAVVLLMLIAFRNRLYAVLCLTPTLFGVVGALFLLRVTGHSVAALALGCGCMLIGVTVDYGVHLLYRTDHAPPNDREGIGALFARLSPAVAFGALTTMAAFFIMIFSPVGGHRNLGWFGLMGVSLAAVFALVVVPLIAPAGGDASRRGQPVTRVLRWVLGWRERQRHWVLPLVVTLSVAAALGLMRVEFDGKLSSLNGVTEDTRRDEAAVRDTWEKALSLTTVVVSGSDVESARTRNEQVLAALGELSFQNRITRTVSVAGLMPSEATRERNRQRWREFWTPRRVAEAGRVLRTTGQELGFRPAAFEPFLEWLAKTLRPDAHPAPGSVLPESVVEEFQVRRGGAVSLLTQVKLAEPSDFTLVQTAVTRVVPDAKLFNKEVLMDRMAAVARETMPIFVVGIVVLNGLLLWVLLGRWALVAVSLIPTLLGVLWTLGALGLAHVPINIASLVFVIFVVGVGGDYSLFFLMARLEALRGFNEDSAVTGAGVTLCALTTLLGVGVLVFAQHPALHAVGLTAVLGISFSLLATLLVVPLGVDFLLNRQTRRRMPPPLEGAALRRQVELLYRYQGPYVEHFVHWKMRADPMFDVLNELVPREGRILDLGCGYGHVAHCLTLAAPGRSVIGMDYDRDKIRVARATQRLNPRVSFLWADLQVPFREPCDHAVVLDVLHYLPTGARVTLLRSVADGIRDGGTLVLRDAFSEDPAAWARVARSERRAVNLSQSKATSGLHFERESVLLAAVREAGFDSIRKHPTGGVNAIVTAVKRAGTRSADDPR